MIRQKRPLPVIHHFIDEAGDLSLFNRRKQVVVGNEGVSNYFMVGAAHIPDPAVLDERLRALRTEILRDSLLNRIPSLDPSRKKTAIAFHAKDDPPEVRYAVFKLLNTTDTKMFVAIRTKRVIVEEAKALFRYGLRISDNQIYDNLISRLLRNRLHLAESNVVVIARRGTKDRKDALMEAIRRAEPHFAAKWGERQFGVCSISTAYPHEVGGLQAVDYFLWAVQRLYERRDDRYFAPLAQHFRIIMDLDDTRRRAYGEWYSDSNPLTLERIKPVTG